MYRTVAQCAVVGFGPLAVPVVAQRPARSTASPAVLARASRMIGSELV